MSFLVGWNVSLERDYRLSTVPPEGEIVRCIGAPIKQRLSRANWPMVCPGRSVSSSIHASNYFFASYHSAVISRQAVAASRLEKPGNMVRSFASEAAPKPRVIRGGRSEHTTSQSCHSESDKPCLHTWPRRANGSWLIPISHDSDEKRATLIYLNRERIKAERRRERSEETIKREGRGGRRGF